MAKVPNHVGEDRYKRAATWNGTRSLVRSSSRYQFYHLQPSLTTVKSSMCEAEN